MAPPQLRPLVARTVSTLRRVDDLERQLDAARRENDRLREQLRAANDRYEQAYLQLTAVRRAVA